MSRRRAGALLVAVAVFVVSGCERAPNPAAPVAVAPRRVLLVTLDTTRADHLGCYGRAEARTPFLDGVAREGVRFGRAWCAAPITLPSHATILTATWPSAHGVRDNGLYVLSDAATLLPEVLHADGFATGAFVGSFILDARFGLAQGFDVYHGPPPSTLGVRPEVVQRSAGQVVDDALAWIDGLPAAASFFAWIHFYDPHAPHPVSYDAEIADCDAQLARLHQRLERRGFTQGLLEIVTADHGEGLGDHGEETHGLLLHDATMRVPLLVRGGGAAAGLVVDLPVGNAQIAPTVLAWLGIEASALPDASVAALPLTPAAAAAASTDEAPPLPLETFLPFHLHRWHPLQGLVWRGRKLVRGTFDELFDLAADPGESKDLAGAQPEVVKALAQRLDALVAAEKKLPAPRGPELSAAERAELRALGYAGDAGAGGATSTGETLDDPRARIGSERDQARAFELLTQARALLGQDAALAQKSAPVSGPAQRERALQLLEEARALLQTLAEKQPRDPSVAFDLGNVHLSAGRPADAAPCFERALLADPESSQGHYNLAVAYAGSGQTAFAIAEMEKAVACEPRFVRACMWLIATHELAGDFGRAAWWVEQLAASGALADAEQAPMRAKREQLRARMAAAGTTLAPPPAWPPKDFRPERLRQ